jgi:hypothetical protein
MKSLSNSPLQSPARRSLLWSLVRVGAAAGTSVGLTSKALALKPERNSETVYRILTPECEVQLSVEYFGSSETSSLRFRDFLTRRAFCASPNGEEDHSCAA